LEEEMTEMQIRAWASRLGLEEIDARGEPDGYTIWFGGDTGNCLQVDFDLNSVAVAIHPVGYMATFYAP